MEKLKVWRKNLELNSAIHIYSYMYVRIEACMHLSTSNKLASTCSKHACMHASCYIDRVCIHACVNVCMHKAKPAGKRALCTMHACMNSDRWNRAATTTPNNKCRQKEREREIEPYICMHALWLCVCIYALACWLCCCSVMHACIATVDHTLFIQWNHACMHVSTFHPSTRRVYTTSSFF
jgi:hypothetical protein